MRILITGREGQVARSLAEHAGSNHELVFAARPQFDLKDPASIEAFVAKARPDLVINAAAYTAVDRAEDEPAVAFAINAEAPATLADAARKVGAPIIHLSTDYVFEGSLDRPYVEEDPVAPIGVYGRSKLAGEEAIRASGAEYLIMRTAWVYSPFGNNFVKTMLRLAADRESLTVVNDQFGNPTSALDIADALLVVADAWGSKKEAGNSTYHFAGSGETNWADFARHIFSSSARSGGPSSDVQGIPSSAWPTKAARPGNSRLDCGKFSQTFGHSAPDWQTSADEVVRRLLS